MKLKNVIDKIIIKNAESDRLIAKEQLLRARNISQYTQAKTVLSFFSRFNDLSTEFEPMVGFMEDDEITVLYKQWDVEIYSNANLSDYLPYIVNMVNYEVIYNDPAPNNILYYNTHMDLKTTHFWEMRDTLLILHVSSCINKVVGGSELIVPSVKLRITAQNSLVVNN